MCERGEGEGGVHGRGEGQREELERGLMRGEEGQMSI